VGVGEGRPERCRRGQHWQGGAGESGGDGGAFDDSGANRRWRATALVRPKAKLCILRPEQDTTAAKRLLHEVQRQALDSARERGEPASALHEEAPTSAPAPGWAHSA